MLDYFHLPEDGAQYRRIRAAFQRAFAATILFGTDGLRNHVDVGVHRCGVPPGQPTMRLAWAALQKDLRFRGLVGYEGQVVRKLPGPEKEQEAAAANPALVETAAALRQEGIPVEILSGGGTDTYSLSGRCPGMTEIQVGSYLLMDTDYQKCCTDFDLSLTVLTSVLSKTEGERIVVDAGLKSLSCERGILMVKDMRGLSVRKVTAEHGIIDIKDPAAAVEAGDKIEIWVHYSDAAVNLHDRMCGIRAGQVDEIFRV